MSVHFDIEELADAAGGVLDAERTRQVKAHVDGCPTCRDTWTALSDVTARLQADPAPPMPPEVAARLQHVVAQQSTDRGGSPRNGVPGRPTQPAAGLPKPTLVKPTLGTFGADLPKRSASRFWLSVAGAAVAASIIGFGGYVLSAAAGLNEPSASAPAAVSSGRLGPEARSLSERVDLSPHRFSQAWQCARDVTDGRIVGITPVLVDGQPALLVYTAKGDGREVTVVTGCGGQEQPVAGPSTTLPR